MEYVSLPKNCVINNYFMQSIMYHLSIHCLSVQDRWRWREGKDKDNTITATYISLVCGCEGDGSEGNKI